MVEYYAEYASINYSVHEENMKNFLVFMGQNYYPNGGWDDFIDSFNTDEEASHYIHERAPGYANWAQVVDTTTTPPTKREIQIKRRG